MNMSSYLEAGEIENSRKVVLEHGKSMVPSLYQCEACAIVAMGHFLPVQHFVAGAGQQIIALHVCQNRSVQPCESPNGFGRKRKACVTVKFGGVAKLR